MVLNFIIVLNGFMVFYVLMISYGLLMVYLMASLWPFMVQNIVLIGLASSFLAVISTNSFVLFQFELKRVKESDST